MELKLNKDWGSTLAAIDNCLPVRDQYDAHVQKRWSLGIGRKKQGGFLVDLQKKQRCPLSGTRGPVPNWPVSNGSG
ncbi:hypothetical protein DVH24_031980 [Malus domestica]|uniref:Uncharacterized protein n=1 Tax=Malus domestica TaxID=3750 RepID=A0A498J748_MALDO|nr:hypothetical protein DVH24_031980 [Malus domestica]